MNLLKIYGMYYIYQPLFIFVHLFSRITSDQDIGTYSSHINYSNFPTTKSSRNWIQLRNSVLSYPKWINEPTKPMNIPHLRRRTSIEPNERIYHNISKIPSIPPLPPTDGTATPSILTEETPKFVQKFERNDRLSMKLTVLEAEIPSKVIAYPNAHKFTFQTYLEELNRRSKLLQEDDKLVVGSGDTNNGIHEAKAIQKLDDIAEELPKAQMLVQVDHPNRYSSGNENNDIDDMIWDLDDRFVCQIHRCTEGFDHFNQGWREEHEILMAKREMISFPIGVDFEIGTDILRDIWNNHLREDDIFVEAESAIKVEDYSVSRDEKTDLMFKLGLGSKSDPSMKPPPLQKDQEGKQNFEFKKSQKQDEANDKSSDLYTKMGVLEEHQNDAGLEEGFLNNNHFWLNQQANLNFPDQYNGNDITDNMYPVQDIISSKIGMSDGSPPSHFHQLPPSVLPSIHENAREGKIIQNGKSTRIILRLNPSSSFPDGEVMSLPASKFNKNGRADLTLDNGQRISVRIKHETDGKQVEDSSRPSSFAVIHEGPSVNELAAENVPLTILRDSQSGTPILALPALNNGNIRSNLDKQLIRPLPPTVPNNNLPPQLSNFQPQLPSFQPQLPLVQQNPILGFRPQQNGNPNGDGGIMDMFSTENMMENVDIMRNQIRQGFRGFMRQFETIPEMMEEDMFQSFDSSVNFLRRFYGNALPDSYFGDSMTVMSMAAFAAFVGARMADMSRTLAVAGIGRRALNEIENFIGREKSDTLSDIIEVVHSKIYAEENYFDTNNSSVEEDSSSRSNKIHNNIKEYNFLEDIESVAAVVDLYLDPLLRYSSDNSTSKRSCLQRQLCDFTSEGVKKGGLSNLLTPLASVTIGSLHFGSQDFPPSPLTMLSVLRPLWLANTRNSPTISGPGVDEGACHLIQCQE